MKIIALSDCSWHQAVKTPLVKKGDGLCPGFFVILLNDAIGRYELNSQLYESTLQSWNVQSQQDTKKSSTFVNLLQHLAARSSTSDHISLLKIRQEDKDY